MEAGNWLLAKGRIPMLRSQTRAMLRENGIALTEEEEQRIYEQHVASLKETGRIEFGGSAVDLIVGAFARSSVLMASDAADALCAAVEQFYTLRSAISVEVGDAEIADALLEAFEECEGALELIDIDKLSNELAQTGEGYSVADDEGKTYHWNPAEWEYSEQTDGWEGEPWVGDFDE